MRIDSYRTSFVVLWIALIFAHPLMERIMFFDHVMYAMTALSIAFILVLRTLGKCAFCRQVVPVDLVLKSRNGDASREARFCPHCGKSLDEPPANLNDTRA